MSEKYLVLYNLNKSVCQLCKCKVYLYYKLFFEGHIAKLKTANYAIGT